MWIIDTRQRIWTNTELDQAITEALAEVSKKYPYIVVESLVTQEDSRNVDISGVSDLLYGYDVLSIASPEGVEYPTAEWPKKYRNYKISGTNLVMDITTAPSDAGDDVYVTCLKVHTVDSLPPAIEPLVVKIAAARAAINKPLDFLNDFQAETTKFDNITTAIGNVSAMVTQFIADMTSGRALIGDERESATEAIDTMTERIVQQVADIASARTFFNKANIARPEQEYLASASQEAQSAMGYLNQARGYISEETASGAYRSQATGQLNGATAYLNQARGYLEHFRLRIADINLADKYEAWGQRRLQQVQPELAGITQRRVWKEWPKD